MDIQQTKPAGHSPSIAHGTDVLGILGADGRADPKLDPKLHKDFLRELYKAMVRTRVVDERLVLLQRQGRIGFHIGSLGEEGCILASAAAMRPQDWIFPCYREFGALLWRGMPLAAYVDNMYGNAGDPVKGRQMPDHYSGKPYKFGSVSSPIGTQITQAVGFAWAAKIQKDDVVASVFFGEGATSSAEFHTGLNFAGVFNTPVVFLCRNNQWAISVPSEKQTASATYADKGIAYGVRGVRCDGNDVLAVYKVVSEAVERAARGEGPTLVELVTYRISGHSTSDDPRAYRKDDEVTEWRKTDPLSRLRKHLDVLGAWSDAEDKAVRDAVDAELKTCIAEAEAKPKPAIETMFEEVLAELPWHLREQQEQCARGPRAKGGH